MPNSRRSLSPDLRRSILMFQENEITEHHLYNRLASITRDERNRAILKRIADDERRHYDEWKAFTGEDVSPSQWRIWLYYLISRVFGITFGLKLMERGEAQVQKHYERITERIPEVRILVVDENEHEEALLGMLDEEHLRYIGSIVLGLNDALVELTGALAGLTFALRNASLVALSGLITGIAAAMSMAASEYLSTKAEDTTRSPGKASIYTGIAYIVTVFALVLPYLLVPSVYLALGITLIMAIGIVALFNFYYAVVADTDFRSRFLEMAGLSMFVATLSFGVGLLARHLLGVEV